MIELLTPVGRLVSGHPMHTSVKKDNAGVVKNGSDGLPLNETYVGIAISKGAEQHWNQTPWGQAIHAEAVAGFPNGEHGAATFAWKITDGDSPIPNKKGKKPCDREGFPGHWVLGMSTFFGLRCFHAGRVDPTQQIQDKGAIKAGDYCRLAFQAKPNNIAGPNDSPGVYLNPQLFELTRAGIEIQTSTGPSAADVFATAGAMPAGALIDTAVQQPAAPAQSAPLGGGVIPPAQSAPGFLSPAPAPTLQQAPVEKQYFVEGANRTETALRAVGYTDAHFATMTPVA